MWIDLRSFYDYSGIMMCIFSLLMLAIRRQEGEDGRKFNAAKLYLAVMFAMSGLSMFLAQLESRIDDGDFEKLNALMLLLFFLISWGFIFSFLVLYASRYAGKKTLNKAVLPVFILFSVYTFSYIAMGDVKVYSAEEFMSSLPGEPLLMLRCIILVCVVLSVLYGVKLCLVAKREYNKLICSYFSETDFSRSVWLSNLFSAGLALSFWVFFTYFYTNTVLEVVVGIFMVTVFGFYVKAFYDYSERYELFRPALLMSRQGALVIGVLDDNRDQAEKQSDEDELCASLLNGWCRRGDKPFTKPGLTINDVAHELNIPRYRISNHINRGQKNFCSWVNLLRIEEASRMLAEEDGLTISEIAVRTGFCDLPAFSRAFKKEKNISPSEFRNGIAQNKK